MIEVHDLHKRFRLYEKPSDRLREIIFRRQYHHTHVALDHLTFRVDQGETLGVIGSNGAGKSTLLKLLTGVLLPDSGSIRVDGRITGLLELGTGFDPDLTGEQNIRANGMLLGMTTQEIDARTQEIIEFSELGHFIKEPIRTYSSGMVMRLGFSVAIHANPSAFVVDEALSVGDAHFQQKCMRRIRAFQARGGSIIFVSHDLNAVKMLCDRVIVLDKGHAAFDGDSEGAVNHYNQIIADFEADLAERTVEPERGYGSRVIEITEGKFLGSDSRSTTVSVGETAHVDLHLRAHQKARAVTIGILIRDRFGQDIFGTNSHHLGNPLTFAAGETRQVRFSLPMELAPGKYTLTAALHSEENHLQDCYHWWDNLVRFEVAGIRGPIFAGLCRLDARFDPAPVVDGTEAD